MHVRSVVMDPAVAVAVAVAAPLVRAEASPPFHASSAKGERAGIERRRPLSYSGAAGAGQLLPDSDRRSSSLARRGPRAAGRSPTPGRRRRSQLSFPSHARGCANGQASEGGGTACVRSATVRLRRRGVSRGWRRI